MTRCKCRRTHLIETLHPTVRHLYLNDRAIVATIFGGRSGTRGIRYHGRLVVSFLQPIRFFIYCSSFHAVLFCCVLCFLFWRCLAGTFKGETRAVFSDIGASLGFRMPNQNHKDWTQLNKSIEWFCCLWKKTTPRTPTLCWLKIYHIYPWFFQTQYGWLMLLLAHHHAYR